MEGTRKRPWSDLPPELLSMIGTRLHTRMDVLRFRSVCSSVRSSIPLPHRSSLRFPFRITCLPGTALFLRKRTVYTLETPDGAASCRMRWLLKLEESELGNMPILSLFSQQRLIVSLPCKFPLVLDSLQFRMVEICSECTLECRGMQRELVHPDCAWTNQDQCLVYFIDGGGQLWYWKYEDENRSHLGCGYGDIVVYQGKVYQGKVYVVDKSGSVSQVDSSFRLQSFSLPINHGCGCHCRHWKHLVVSSGDLYAVDICSRLGEIMRTPDFRVYRLDQQCGRWEEVRSLGNSAFFLCNLCSFAVSAREVHWCKGDCIYYAGRSFSSYFSKDKVMMFSLADCRHKCPDFSVLFKDN
ncbi:putative F-box protein At5g60060 [Rhodamnia argentea]|uniref:F-box protein At5g60060 n=1 Tax=Rhodamnia argentea TaxID=178133 RepID=A0A8B8PMB4_9MYRT|nr:putative F-box protein At5g60060 [Rhodamnia argentea]